MGVPECSLHTDMPSRRCTSVQVPVKRLLALSRWVFGLALIAAALYVHAGSQGLLKKHLSSPQERSLSGTDAAADGEEAVETLEGKMSFLCVGFLVSCLLHQFNNSVPDIMTMPLTVLLFMIGMFVGLLFLRALEGVDWEGNDVDELVAGMREASSINPHALLFIILPPLLYESASAMNWRVLRKILPSAVILAGPGVVVNTALTGLFSKVLLTVGDESMGWGASFLLASILSATDPVAVVAALQDLGAPKKLATLIEGESLMNDGSAVVFFFIFLDMVATEAPDSQKQCPSADFLPAAACILGYFLRLAVGGVALGAAVSFVVYAWIAQAEADRHAEVLEVAVVLVAVYGTFFLAESIHVSGVLAVVMLGMMSTAFISTSMSSHGRHSHHVVFRQVSYACNQVIFFGAGMITARFMWTNHDGVDALFKDVRHWGQLLFLYVGSHVSRSLVLLLFSPLLTRLGYGVTPKECLILVWGGLRGAVGLTLGLLVEDSEYVDAEVSSTIAFHVSGIVMLTLLVNGTTIEWVYKHLQLYPPNPFRMTYLRKVLATLEKEFMTPFSKKGLTSMKSDWFFKDVDFVGIMKSVPNFRHLEFDTAGIPYPTELQSVYDCLNNLEAPGKKVIDQPFRQAWEKEKQRHRSALIDCLRTTASKSGDLKDVLWNITNTGDQRLEYRGFTGGPIGIYASARPLTRIRPSPALQHMAGRDNALGFSVVIHTNEQVSLNVGLCIGLEAVHRVDELPLGIASDTVGYDVQSGKIRVNSAEGVQEFELSPDLLAVPLKAVHIMAAQEPGEEWQIVFLAERAEDGEMLPLVRCTVGPYPPSELHPSVQLLDAPDRSHPPAAGIKRLKTAHSLGDLSPFNQIDGKAQHAVLTLSYELQTATESESLNQIFHAIFNSAIHQYREMHEHGLIGNDALAWLEGATGEAVDCADHELHHSKVADFSRLLHSSDGTSRCTPRAREVAGLLRAVSPDDGSTPGTYMSMFEPLIVEYMTLELFCSQASLWDMFPSSWSVMRKRGYGQLLTKVESLWAFIQVHERVLKESSAIERHPHLITCMKAIIKEAKGDLEIIKLLKPRRFYYSKQYLALRVIMRRKLDRLESFVQEGWLSTEDSAKLEESLWDRIHAIKHFVPKNIPARRLTGRQSAEKAEFLLEELQGTPLAVIPSGNPASIHFDSEDTVFEAPSGTEAAVSSKANKLWQRRSSAACRSSDILGADIIVSDMGDQSFSAAQFALSKSLAAGMASEFLARSSALDSPLTPSPFILPNSVMEPPVDVVDESTTTTSADANKQAPDSSNRMLQAALSTDLQMDPFDSDGA
mmetsp:Transcript_21895/g.49949  ORF Transcript_21895/g.49949 Transcript_21895/m.49949 type:complete len:1315 (+) Transcript_21895:90-4034(+)